MLDTARGVPAAGLRIELHALDGSRTRVADRLTNADGRVDAPLLEGAAFTPGSYELLFHAGPYFEMSGIALPGRRFLDVIPVRFEITDDSHYHVPLLLSPYGYSTYRGS